MKPSLVAAAAATASTPATTAIVKSFSGEGVSFFNALRTPAALVAAAAIKDAFVLTSAPDDIQRSRAWTTLRNTYLLLQLLAFGVEIGCIFVLTHAIMRLSR